MRVPKGDDIMGNIISLTQYRRRKLGSEQKGAGSPVAPEGALGETVPEERSARPEMTEGKIMAQIGKKSRNSARTRRLLKEILKRKLSRKWDERK